MSGDGAYTKAILRLINEKLRIAVALEKRAADLREECIKLQKELLEK